MTERDPGRQNETSQISTNFNTFLGQSEPTEHTLQSASSGRGSICIACHEDNQS